MQHIYLCMFGKYAKMTRKFLFTLGTVIIDYLYINIVLIEGACRYYQIVI